MRDLKIFGGLVIAAVVVYTFVFLWQQSQPKEVVYEVMKAEVRDLRKKTVATGKVEPRDEVNIKPKIQGIITELYVSAGDVVEEGAPIAKISVIPEIGQLANAQSSLRSAELSLEQSERDYARTKSLYEKKVVSREEFEKAETDLAKMREQVAAATDQVQIITRGISARSGKVNTTIVTSTVAGTILNIPVKVGSSVQATGSFSKGTTVATMANMGDIIFRGNIDETEVGRMHRGMPLSLTIGALRDVTIPATLEYISPKGTESNGAVLFEIKAAAQIADTLTIRAGYSANAEIVLDERTQVLAIPELCLEMAGDSSFVHVLTSEEGVTPQTFERRAVEIGMSDGIYIEVKGGLKGDERLRGNEKMEEKK